MSVAPPPAACLVGALVSHQGDGAPLTGVLLDMPVPTLEACLPASMLRVLEGPLWLASTPGTVFACVLPGIIAPGAPPPACCREEAEQKAAIQATAAQYLEQFYEVGAAAL